MDLLRTTGDQRWCRRRPRRAARRPPRRAPFTATAANVTAASPTGKITLGNVLGNTPDPEGDKNLATSFTLGGDMMLQPHRADDDLRHEPHDDDGLPRLRDVQLGRHHAHERAPRPLAPHGRLHRRRRSAASTGVLDMLLGRSTSGTRANTRSWSACSTASARAAASCSTTPPPCGCPSSPTAPPTT